MKLKALAIGVAIVTFVLGGCASNSSQRNPSKNGADDPAVTLSTENSQAKGAAAQAGSDAVKASVGDNLVLKAGSSADATVSVIVGEGFHVNANPPSMPYLIATQVTVEPPSGFVAGKPLYPAPSATRKFQFAETPLAVYEGTVNIKVPVKAEVGATRGEHSIKASLRVQPCDEQVCYPPRTLSLSIPVTVN
jgi:hypothetical protein